VTGTVVDRPAPAQDRRRRVRDGLVGALVLLLVLVLLVVAAFWALSRPSGDGPDATRGPVPGATDAPAPTAPDDLGPDETWLGDVGLGTSELVSPDATLLDVVATGSGVRSGPDGITAASLRVEATLPFAAVAADLGDDATVTAADDGQAELRRTATVLGRTVDLRATGTVRAEGGLIVVEPQRIDVGGPDFLAGPTATVVRGLVTIRQPVEGVPEGLVLQQVTVQDDGFRALLSGEDVRLDG
jgi:hypothetical protein